MFDWLSKLLGLRSAVEARRENPVLLAAVSKSSEIYAQTPLAECIGREAGNRLAREIYLDVNAVCNATDPLAAGREKLAGTMLRFALFQVLMIPPPPKKDASGLRALPGISGEIAHHLTALADHNIALRGALHGSEYYSDSAELWPLVRTEYWKTWWLLETLNTTRQELGDVVAGRDWYRPFMHAACANQENLYRIDLDLPPAFAETIARHAPTAYSIFTDIVIAGAADPLAEWREFHEGQAVPTPGESRGERRLSAARA